MLAPLLLSMVPAVPAGDPTDGPPPRFCVIGDFGEDGIAEADVAAMVLSLNPNFIATVGDNNYPDGEATTIDDNVGQYYHSFIHPYTGAYGAGATVNRFFPALGNHDWRQPNAQPHLDYFELPGNERYYDVVWDSVHLFVIDTDDLEPDGITKSSVQGQWLKSALEASTSPFKLVLMHHPPYSSSNHGPHPVFHWPYYSWGADAVLAGHDHVFERLDIDGLPYFVNGLGGGSVYDFFDAPAGGSEYRFRDDWGAQLCDVFGNGMRWRFLTRTGIVMDDYTLLASDRERPLAPLISPGAVWRYLDDGSTPDSSWIQMSFDDSAWSAGPAPLGYVVPYQATILGYGPDREDKFITTYFRKTFTARDFDAITHLRMDLRADDGAIVYLNGTEIHRVNMPAGPVNSETTALFETVGKAQNTHYEIELDPTTLRMPKAPPMQTMLRPGRNVVAVEVHQVAESDPDLTFELKLIARRDTETLLAGGGLWNYLDDGTDPGATWVDDDFDDSAWDEGNAPLGYGEGDEATLLDFGGDPMDKHATTFFRSTFDVEDAAGITGLELGIVRDDGAVVYVNGIEVYRFDLPMDGVTFETLAAYPLEGAIEREFLRTRINPAVLVEGTNTVAVEVHQCDPTNADHRFDLEILGER